MDMARLVGTKWERSKGLENWQGGRLVPVAP